MKTTRRALLHALAGGTASASALPLMHMLGVFVPTGARAQPLALPPELGRSKKVVILGAGIAGLVAAYELRRAGFQCLVLEALSRPGGRCWTIRPGDIVAIGTIAQACEFSAGLYFNAGPTRIPSQHASMLNYCRELGVALEIVASGNQNALIHLPHLRQTLRQHAVRANIRGALARLATVGLDAPALGPKLSDSQRMQLEEFLRLFASASNQRTAPCAPDRECPEATIERLLMALDANTWRWLQLDERDETLGTMLQPVGGMDRLPFALARHLSSSIRYQAEVTEIRKTAHAVRVVYRDTSNGQTASTEGDFCVSTLPLPVLSLLKTDLSRRHREALALCEFEEATKIAWQAPRFWQREDGIYGGVSFTGDRTAMIGYPSEEPLRDEGILLGAYTTGFASRSLASLPLPRQHDLSRQAVDKVHPGRAQQLTRPICVSWSALPYSRGAWAKSATLSDLRTLPADDRIFLAGDQMSELSGWQEGAVLSAHDCVRAIAQRAVGA